MNVHVLTRLGLTAGLLAAVASYPALTVAQTSSGSFGGAITDAHEESKQWLFTLGAGAGVMPDYEGGDDYEFVPIPIASAQKGHRFAELLGFHVTSNILNSKHWRLGPSLNFRKGYNNIDNERVDALTDRGNSFEVGAKGGYEFTLSKDRTLGLSFEVLADVASGHEGLLFTPSVDFGMPLGSRWDLGLGAEVTYASGDYMSHFFSVNAEDSARSGLDNYDADADFKSTAAHVLITYTLTPKWRIHAYGEYKRMLGDAEDSPVVDDEGDENQGFGAVAVTYTW